MAGLERADPAAPSPGGFAGPPGGVRVRHGRALEGLVALTIWEACGLLGRDRPDPLVELAMEPTNGIFYSESWTCFRNALPPPNREDQSSERRC